MNRYKDWLMQAEKDMEATLDSEKYEHYEWKIKKSRCFKYVAHFLFYY